MTCGATRAAPGPTNPWIDGCDADAAKRECVEIAVVGNRGFNRTDRGNALELLRVKDSATPTLGSFDEAEWVGLVARRRTRGREAYVGLDEKRLAVRRRFAGRAYRAREAACEICTFAVEALVDDLGWMRSGTVHQDCTATRLGEPHYNTV